MIIYKQFCYVKTFLYLLRLMCFSFCFSGNGDSFGREYLLRLPDLESASYKSCWVYVTIPTPGTAVAVWEEVTRGVVPIEREYDYVKIYKCELGNATINIYTGTDVSVNVILKSERNIVTFPVYPVDTYDYDFQSYSLDESEYCLPISNYENVSAKLHAQAFINNTKHDSGFQFNINGSLIKQSGSHTWAITFTKPSTMFCYNTVKHVAYQSLPVNVWSTKYHIHGKINEMLNITANIVSSTDNNNVSITRNGENENIIVNSFEVKRFQNFYLSNEAYQVTSKSPIGVGLELVNADTLKQSFFLIPPVSSFINTTESVSLIPFGIISDNWTVHQFTVDGSSTTSYNKSDAVDEVHNVHTYGQSYTFSVVVEEFDTFFAVPGYSSVRPTVIDLKKM